MKSVLLIGLGRFGRHMALKLQELGHDVLAVDQDEIRVNAALSYVTDAQIGNATDEAFVKTLGVRNFDLCVVAIGDDFESSLEATALLKDNGASFVLSRAATDVHAKFLLRNGADDVIYPASQ
ncbi:MAG: NAD-binding protein, partial [Gemmiger sp.]|nr:NAD-binding protein [Gemmiger sp.]